MRFVLVMTILLIALNIISIARRHLTHQQYDHPQYDQHCREAPWRESGTCDTTLSVALNIQQCVPASVISYKSNNAMCNEMKN